MEAVAEVLTAALAGQKLKWSHTIKLYNSKTKIGLIYIYISTMMFSNLKRLIKLHYAYWNLS